MEYKKTYKGERAKKNPRRTLFGVRATNNWAGLIASKKT